MASISNPVLISPANNAVLSNAPITFSWEEVFDAEKYILQISKISGVNNNILLEHETSNTSVSVSGFVVESTYQWSVKAVGAGEESDWVSRIFQTAESGNGLIGAGDEKLVPN